MQSDETGKKVTVVTVDDNTDLRNALADLFEFNNACHLLATCESCEEATERIPLLKPNVVLMDINLGGIDGIKCVSNIKKDHPEINFMMCTVSEETDKIFEALRAGASGYVLKKTQPHKLVEAVLELSEGGAPISSQIAMKIIQTFQPGKVSENNAAIDNLTPREHQILSLLSKGLVYREIADQLFISAETVRKHVYHIYEKLHVKNRVEAVNMFFGRTSNSV